MKHIECLKFILVYQQVLCYVLFGSWPYVHGMKPIILNMYGSIETARFMYLTTACDKNIFNWFTVYIFPLQYMVNIIQPAQ